MATTLTLGLVLMCIVYIQGSESSCFLPIATWQSYGNSIYGVNNGGERVYVNDARSACQACGGELASFSSHDEFNFIKTLLQQSVYSYWIGLYKPNPNKEITGWTWFDFSPYSTDQTQGLWESGQPYGGENENYATISHSSGWKLHDRYTSSRASGYICKKTAVQFSTPNFIIQPRKKFVENELVCALSGCVCEHTGGDPLGIHIENPTTGTSQTTYNVKFSEVGNYVFECKDSTEALTVSVSVQVTAAPVIDVDFEETMRLLVSSSTYSVVNPIQGSWTCGAKDEDNDIADIDPTMEESICDCEMVSVNPDGYTEDMIQYFASYIAYSFTFNKPGSVTYKCTVSDMAGNTDSKEFTMNVQTAPQVRFSSPGLETGEVIEVHDNSPIDWAWSCIADDLDNNAVDCVCSLVSATDPEGNTFSFDTDAPVFSDNQRAYTGSFSREGLYEFNCTASDSDGLSSTKYAFINVNEEHSPTLNIGIGASYVMPGDGPALGSVSCNAVDEDDNLKDCPCTSSCALLTKKNGNGWNYDAVFNKPGNCQVKCTAIDDTGKRAVQTKSSMIYAAPTAAPISNKKLAIGQSGEAVGQVKCNANDRDSDSVTCSCALTSGPDTAVITVENSASGIYRVVYKESGSYIFTCTAEDNQGHEHSATTTTNVYYKPTVDVTIASRLAVKPGETASTDLECNPADQDDDIAKCECELVWPEWSNFMKLELRDLSEGSYTAKFTKGNVFTFKCTAVDEQGFKASGSATIWVDHIPTLSATSTSRLTFLENGDNTLSGTVECNASDVDEDKESCTCQRKSEEVNAMTKRSVLPVQLTETAPGKYNALYNTGGQFVFVCTAVDSEGNSDSEETTTMVYYAPMVEPVATSEITVEKQTAVTGNLDCESSDMDGSDNIVSCTCDVLSRTDRITGSSLTNDARLSQESRDRYTVAFTGQAYGVYTFECYAKDAQGHVSLSKQATTTVYQAPIVDVTATEELTIAGDKQPVTGKLSCNPEDLDGDLTNCVCSLKNSADASKANLTVVNAKQGEYSVEFSKGGEFQFECVATDDRGNTESGMATTVVDYEPTCDPRSTPELDIGPDRAAVTGFVNCRPEDEDGQTNIVNCTCFQKSKKGGAIMRLVNAEIGRYRVTYSAGGEYQFMCVVIDEEGHQGMGETTTNVYYAPTVDPSTKSEVVLYNKPVSAKLRCGPSDRDGDLVNCTCDLVSPSPADSVSLILKNSKFGLYEVKYGPEAADGEYTYSCTATDGRGNTDTEQVTTNVIHKRYCGPNADADIEWVQKADDGFLVKLSSADSQDCDEVEWVLKSKKNKKLPREVISTERNPTVLVDASPRKIKFELTCKCGDNDNVDDTKLKLPKCKKGKCKGNAKFASSDD